jgi:hypothetical protein
VSATISRSKISEIAVRVWLAITVAGSRESSV